MSSTVVKLPSTRHGILQPKRFNTNHTPGVVIGNCSTLSNDPLGIGGNHLAPKESSLYPSSFGGRSEQLSSLFLSLGSNATPPIPGCGNLVRTRPPNTMAKRNARERNRVKQVNQGFLQLKHHIPQEFRAKKMSKVDTLRSAINYIRKMEEILDLSFSDEGEFKMIDEDFSNTPTTPPESELENLGINSTSNGSGEDQSYSFELDTSAIYGIGQERQRYVMIKLSPGGGHLVGELDEQNCIDGNEIILASALNVDVKHEVLAFQDENVQ